MNRVSLIGRLTKDPEVRYTGENNTCVARYTLAVNRMKEGADFISCVAFGKCGEFAEKYLKKGQQIGVAGRLQTGSYEKDGQKHYTTDVVVESHTFCGKSEGNSAPSNADFMAVPEGIEDEIPFGK